jgi:hypothetical protein
LPEATYFPPPGAKDPYPSPQCEEKILHTPYPSDFRHDERRDCFQRQLQVAVGEHRLFPQLVLDPLCFCAGRGSLFRVPVAAVINQRVKQLSNSLRWNPRTPQCLSAPSFDMRRAAGAASTTRCPLLRRLHHHQHRNTSAASTARETFRQRGRIGSRSANGRAAKRASNAATGGSSNNTNNNQDSGLTERQEEGPAADINIELSGGGSVSSDGRSTVFPRWWHGRTRAWRRSARRRRAPRGRRIAEDGLRLYAPLLHALVGGSAIIKYDDTNMNIEANASEGRLYEADDGTPRTNASSTKVRPDPNVV